MNNLEESDTMLSGTVITWAEPARKDGMQEGRREGQKEGRREGLIEGRTELARSTLERLLTRRFGPPPPPEAADRIRQAALPERETWLDRIIDSPSMQAVFEDH